MSQQHVRHITRSTQTNAHSELFRVAPHAATRVPMAECNTSIRIVQPRSNKQHMSRVLQTASEVRESAFSAAADRPALESASGPSAYWCDSKLEDMDANASTERNKRTIISKKRVFLREIRTGLICSVKVNASDEHDLLRAQRLKGHPTPASPWHVLGKYNLS